MRLDPAEVRRLVGQTSLAVSAWVGVASTGVFVLVVLALKRPIKGFPSQPSIILYRNWILKRHSAQGVSLGVAYAREQGKTSRQTAPVNELKAPTIQSLIHVKFCVKMQSLLSYRGDDIIQFQHCPSDQRTAPQKPKLVSRPSSNSVRYLHRTSPKPWVYGRWGAKPGLSKYKTGFIQTVVNKTKKTFRAFVSLSRRLSRNCDTVGPACYSPRTTTGS
jgi:hypothetical protein